MSAKPSPPFATHKKLSLGEKDLSSCQRLIVC